MTDKFLTPSPLTKSLQYDSDKENQTPISETYRSKPPLLNITAEVSTYDEQDKSVTPDNQPSYTHNTTTSALNKQLEKVNVSDENYAVSPGDGNYVVSRDFPPRQRYTSEDFSEISFDIKPEDMSLAKDVLSDSSKQLVQVPTTPSHVTSHVTSNSSTPHRSTFSSSDRTHTPQHRKHPFDDSTIDHCPALSPTVFIAKDTSSTGFRWSIDDLAELNPADITVDQPSYILEAEKKLHDDTKYQEDTKRFFEQNVIAASPQVPLLKGVTQGSQTNVSLPLDFDLESVIGKQYLLETPPNTQHKYQSDASFRRILFNDKSSLFNDKSSVTDITEEDYHPEMEDIQHSPIIKSLHCSPISDDSPSFIICSNELLPGVDMLSPIECSKPGMLSPIESCRPVFRTPGPTTNSNMMSTPGPGNGNLMSTPGLPTSMMSTPGLPTSTPAPTSGIIGHDHTPASSSCGKRKSSHTPDHLSLFRNSQFSPFISPIPLRHSANIRRHPKCPKKARLDCSPDRRKGLSSPDNRKVTFKLEAAGKTCSSDMDSPASSVVSPISYTVETPATSMESPLPSPTESSSRGSHLKIHIPMESSRIESGTDTSRSPKLSPSPVIPGIQPLDISEIKPPDMSKLRTNNYLDISDKVSPNVSITNTPSVCLTNTSPDTHRHWSHSPDTDIKQQGSSTKDSGLGTSSAMSTMTNTGNFDTLPPVSNTGNFDTLPPVSELPDNQSNILALDSRPNKRKYAENSPRLERSSSDETGFLPPPVKRVVKVGSMTTNTRRKHWSE